MFTDPNVAKLTPMKTVWHGSPASPRTLNPTLRRLPLWNPKLTSRSKCTIRVCAVPKTETCTLTKLCHYSSRFGTDRSQLAGRHRLGTLPRHQSFPRVRKPLTKLANHSLTFRQRRWRLRDRHGQGCKPVGSCYLVHQQGSALFRFSVYKDADLMDFINAPVGLSTLSLVATSTTLTVPQARVCRSPRNFGR